jgi:hypothetical protein
MLDADTKTVQERLGALDEALESAGQRPIDRNQDPIARLIPKRNIETWILVLSLKGAATSVDEVSDYKPMKNAEEWTALIPAAAVTLFTWTGQPAALPANLIGSLQQGIREIPRALPARR